MNIVPWKNNVIDKIKSKLVDVSMVAFSSVGVYKAVGYAQKLMLNSNSELLKDLSFRMGPLAPALVTVLATTGFIGWLSKKNCKVAKVDAYNTVQTKSIKTLSTLAVQQNKVINDLVVTTQSMGNLGQSHSILTASELEHIESNLRAAEIHSDLPVTELERLVNVTLDFHEAHQVTLKLQILLRNQLIELLRSRLGAIPQYEQKLKQLESDYLKILNELKNVESQLSLESDENEKEKLKTSFQLLEKDLKEKLKIFQNYKGWLNRIKYDLIDTKNLIIEEQIETPIEKIYWEPVASFKLQTENGAEYIKSNVLSPLGLKASKYGKTFDSSALFSKDKHLTLYGDLANVSETEVEFLRKKVYIKFKTLYEDSPLEVKTFNHYIKDINFLKKWSLNHDNNFFDIFEK